MLLSTGASYLWEIEQTVSWLEKESVDYGLLHCVLSYPTADSNANLAKIPELAKRFPNRLIGYSDHTLPKNLRVIETAALLGARVIEKHFTLDKSLRVTIITMRWTRKTLRGSSNR